MTKADTNTATIQDLFSQYSDAEVLTIERIPEAYANDAYTITTGDQRYVLRVLRTQQPETVEPEARLQKRLIAQGIQTPCYLAFKDGTHLGRAHGRYCTLSHFIDGSAPTVANLKLIADFGRTLAVMHHSLENLTVPINRQQWLLSEHAHADLAGYDGPYKARVSRLIARGHQLFDLPLPRSVIHADLWLGNVFTNGPTITVVFDMETACNAPRILDIARTFLSMHRETAYTASQIRTALLQGYDGHATLKLTELENQCLDSAIAYTAGVCGLWLAQNRPEFTEDYLRFGEEAS